MSSFSQIDTPHSIDIDTLSNLLSNININRSMSLEDNPLTQLSQQIENTFNNFRIPDAVKQIPTFDGNPLLLYDFIENVEDILALMPNLNNTPYAKIILRSIRNKIVGNANEVLNSYGTELKWETIRQNLILRYSDKRNELSLIRDLHNLRQNFDSIEKYYSKIIEIFSVMINFVKIHETNQTVVESQKALYTQMCLNTFLCGLKEPFGCTIRSMKPSTLAEAFQYCIQEQNIYYSRYSSKPTFNQSNNSYPKRNPVQNTATTGSNNFKNLQRIQVSSNRQIFDPPQPMEQGSTQTNRSFANSGQRHNIYPVPMEK